jgi:hypothetical protein
MGSAQYIGSATGGSGTEDESPEAWGIINEVSQASQLSPELARGLLQLARALLATARNWALYPPEHQTVGNQVLLKRFVNLMGLFPVGALVRLNTEKLAIITAEHPADPFRPPVKIIRNPKSNPINDPLVTNTRDRDARGEHPRAIVEALDPEEAGIDPLTSMQ